MTQKLSEEQRGVFSKKAFVHLATRMKDGSPQVSPVWVDTEGDYIVVNSAKGRLKDRNMRADPRVALSVTDPDNPYAAIMIRGRVAKITEEGADAQIDKMAKKYLDQDQFPYHTPEEVRVLYYIEPERVGT